MTIAAVTATTAPASTAPATSTSPLGSLNAKMTDFLKLLMTQLRNQDPTTPMDTSQFTSQLVQFASVEQQVNINTGVQSLIQLTQSNNVLQASGVIGKIVTATASQLSLQKGSGTIQFNTPAAEPVAITVKGANGATLAQVSLTSQAGANQWSWDGKNGAGVTMPDGAYAVMVSGGVPGTPSATIPFTISAIASGVTNTGTTQNVTLGAVSVPVSAIKSVGN